MRRPGRSLTAQAERLLENFAAQTGVGPAPAQVLRTVLGTSDDLTDQFNAAIASGELRRLEPLPPGTHAAAEYYGSTKIIKLLVSSLRPSQMNEVAFVLGHEVQHALNQPITARAIENCRRQVGHAARTDHDYTGPVARLVAAQRADEASANIAGWNALAGYRQGLHGRVTLADMARANPRTRDVIGWDPALGRHRAHAGFQITRDQRIELSDRNVGAMARTYVDKPPASAALGYRGNSDYANYYAAQAISLAAYAHQGHNSVDAAGRMVPMKINLAELEVSRELMEQNGIHLRTRRPVPYVDLSTHPPTSGHFHHTAFTHTHVPIRQEISGLAANAAASRSKPEWRLARLSFAGPYNRPISRPKVSAPDQRGRSGIRGAAPRASLQRFDRSES